MRRKMSKHAMLLAMEAPPNRQSSTPWISLAVALAFSVVGCAGEDEFAVGAPSAIGTSDAVSLPSVARDLWAHAPAGCEGMLSFTDTTFGVADGAPELIVVVDPIGVPLCADTYAAIDSELRDIGSQLVDGLWLSYMTTLQEMEVYSGMARTAVSAEHPDSEVEAVLNPLLGPPNPQPNMATDGTSEGNPNPQPNIEGDSASGPPNPQPNRTSTGVDQGNPNPQPNDPMRSGMNQDDGDEDQDPPELSPARLAAPVHRFAS